MENSRNDDALQKRLGSPTAKSSKLSQVKRLPSIGEESSLPSSIKGNYNNYLIINLIYS